MPGALRLGLRSLEGVKTTVQESKRAKSDYVVWQSMSGSGSTTETLALPSFAGGGTFTAPRGLSALTGLDKVELEGGLPSVTVTP